MIDALPGATPEQRRAIQLYAKKCGAHTPMHFIAFNDVSDYTISSLTAHIGSKRDYIRALIVKLRDVFGYELKLANGRSKFMKERRACEKAGKPYHSILQNRTYYSSNGKTTLIIIGHTG